VIVRLRGDRDDGVVPEAIAARGEGHTVNLIAVTVREFLGGQIVAESQRLEDHGMVAIRTGFQMQEQPGRARDLVSEAAPHAQRHIELGCGRNWHSHDAVTHGSIVSATKD
jgi:hypothetical protein